MKIQVSQASGQVLDWLVAQVEGYYATIKPTEIVYVHPNGEWHHNGNWSPSTKWVQGGPIIERESTVEAGRLTIKNKTYATEEGGQIYAASYDGHNWESVPVMYGPTMLIAAMRTYVVSRLGTYAEVPDELA